DQLSDNLREARIYHSNPEISGQIITLRPQNPEQMDKLEQIVRVAIKPEVGAPASHLLEERNGQLLIKASKTHIEKLIQDAVERSLEVVRRRLNETGLVDPTITRQGDDAILVQLPGV